LISELLVNDEKTGPAPAAPMSLTMLVEDEGRNYRAAEYADWLADAGFRDVRRLPLDVPGAKRHPDRLQALTGARIVGPMATAAPDRLHFTGNDEADRLLVENPLALLIGFALDQQVPVQTAFSGPLKLKQRLGRLDAAEIAGMELDRLEAACREKPAVHRFPGTMATRVQELCRVVVSEHHGDASRVWTDAVDADDLRRRIEALPGFGEMKVKALGAVLAKRFGVAAAQGLVPPHPTLGDVDSAQALERYQAQKRAHKASMRSKQA
jgi:uncharacterized HhH-GPD family protein